MQYIKAPKAVAAYLGLTNSRNIFPDGTYLLWDRDISRLCGTESLEDAVAKLGCVILSPREVRDEQSGIPSDHELPQITLPEVVDFMRINGYAPAEVTTESGTDNALEP